MFRDLDSWGKKCTMMEREASDFQRFEISNQTISRSRGGGEMVSAIAFYSDDPSLNPAGY